jgi:hypothetical protein
VSVKVHNSFDVFRQGQDLTDIRVAFAIYLRTATTVSLLAYRPERLRCINRPALGALLPGTTT